MADGRGWLETLALGCAFTAVAAAIGMGAGRVVWTPGGDLAPTQALALATIAFVVPALGEELIFRVALTPGAIKSPADAATAAGALAAFVAWRPLQLALGSPCARPEFAEPSFLAIAALLGAACLPAYQRTGSLWPPWRCIGRPSSPGERL